MDKRKKQSEPVTCAIALVMAMSLTTPDLCASVTKMYPTPFALVQ